MPSGTAKKSGLLGPQLQAAREAAVAGRSVITADGRTIEPRPVRCCAIDARS
ncbi:hypothetical protein ACQEVF_24245 [Nonomuraea polychroma]|uniref:hypothetical protein n=1 Tax=Nonomuraea polychroma TaxID=46176 RepID=UPI003D8C339B